MKISIIVMALILSANIAYTEDRVKLTMKNGNESIGYYELSGNQYCSFINGGTACIDKSEIAKVTPYNGEELNKVVDVDEQKRLLKQQALRDKYKTEVDYANKTRKTGAQPKR